jgi:hypothetical protein
MKKKIKYLLTFITLFLIQNSSVLAYSNYSKGKLSCGNGMITNIPTMIPKTVSIVYMALQIAVPVLLVIFGSIDLIKAISSGKEDEMKKAQTTFLRRLVTGALVFFIFVIVKLLVNSFGNHTAKVVNCMNCFINNSCKK